MFASGRAIGDGLTILPRRTTWLDVASIDGHSVWLLGWNVPLNAISVAYDDLVIAGQFLRRAVGA